MNFSELPVEVTVSLIAIFTIAATGSIAALHSWIRISAEQKGVKDAEPKLIGDGAWNDAYPHDKRQLDTWLRQNGIKPDSHLGDFMRTCWSAWLGGRPASLTELHVLVARRERSHNATRLSAGIAALLLVCGIVGTLSAIKPVLGGFKFDSAGVQTSQGQGDSFDPDAEDAGSDATTDRVNKLIHDLGDAFWPSLAALLGTILVVSCRGLYSLSLHKFTLDLDRFAVDTLIPRYRVPSLSEQYQEVKASLSSVTENLLLREERFHEAVQQLESLVAGISPALRGLDTAAIATKEATEALATGASSITETLNQTLGAKSPIHRAISGLDLVFEKTEQSLTSLSSVVEGIGESNNASRQGLESAIQALAQSVGNIIEDHQTHQAEGMAALSGFKSHLADIPAAIESTSKQAVDAGITAVKSSITQLHDEQKKWHSASVEELKVETSTIRTNIAQIHNEQEKWHKSSTEELKATTAAGLVGVANAGQELATQVGKIAAAVSEIGKIKTDAEVAIKNLTEASQTQITQIGSATKSKIDTATDALTKESIKIGAIVNDLSKARLDPAPSPSFPQNPSSTDWSEDNTLDNGIGDTHSPRADAPQPIAPTSTSPSISTSLPPAQVEHPDPVSTEREEPSQPTSLITPTPSLPIAGQQESLGQDHGGNAPELTSIKSAKTFLDRLNIFSRNKS